MTKPSSPKRYNRALIAFLSLSAIGIAIGSGYLFEKIFHKVNKKYSPHDAVNTKSAASEGWQAVRTLPNSRIPDFNIFDINRCSSQLRLKPERMALADSSNYGLRTATDKLGRHIPNKPQLIIIHETVIGENETVKHFQTMHSLDDDQASYHMLIGRSGQRIRIVPDKNRAYGAGQSAFGDFTIHSKRPNVGSINNIALHVSLVSPPDGNSDATGHSGYTEAQYNTLAKQILLWQARYGIPLDRVSMHALVDRSHSRYDPRSLRWDVFDNYHNLAARTCGFSYLTLNPITHN